MTFVDVVVRVFSEMEQSEAEARAARSQRCISLQKTLFINHSKSKISSLYWSELGPWLIARRSVVPCFKSDTRYAS